MKINSSFYGLCLLTAIVTACSQIDDEQPSVSGKTMPLTFRLQTAATQTGTRSYEGDVAAEDAKESAIGNVNVWLFDNTGTLLDYKDAVDANTTNQVTLGVPQEVIDQRQTVDLYILANADVAGINRATELSNNMTMGQLKDLKLKGTNFTPTGNNQLVNFTNLPVSRILQRQPVVKEEEVAGVPTYTYVGTLGNVKVTRAVSKIRFAFTKSTGLTGAEVLGVQLNGNCIANEEYLFPIDSLSSPSNYASPYIGDYYAHINTQASPRYIASPLTLGSTDGTTTLYANDAIAELNEPADMVWETWKFANPTLTASDYDRAIVSATTYTNGNTTGNSYKTVYLRESDIQLSGTIYYRLEAGGAIKSLNFQMSANEDFARNHEWIVYAYFRSGFPLQVAVVYVTQWKDGGTTNHEVYNW